MLSMLTQVEGVQATVPCDWGKLGSEASSPGCMLLTVLPWLSDMSL